MAWVLLIVGFIASTEIFFHIPVLHYARQVLGVAKKALHTVTSAGISDHHKEKVLLVYARRLLQASVTLFAYLLLALLPVIAVEIAGEWLGYDILSLLVTPQGIVVSCGIVIGYFLLRLRYVPSRRDGL